MALTNSAGRSIITTHATLASRGFDADFKIFFDNVMGELWTSFSPVSEWLEKEGRITKKKPVGRYIQFAVETALGSGVGARGEGDTLPTANGMTVVNGLVDYQKGFKGRFSITEEAKVWGKAGAGAFADVLEQEMRNVENGIRCLEASNNWGCGDGILAYSSGTLSNSTAVVTTRSETYQHCYPGSRWLFEGQKVAAIATLATLTTDTSNSPAGGTAADAWTDAYPTRQTISSINSDISVTLQAANTTAGAYYLADYGSYTGGTEGTQRGPAGLGNIVDDGTFSDTAPNSQTFGCCGLVAATYPTWKALVSHNSGTARALTTDLIYQMYFKMARRAGDMKHKPVCWTNTDVFREFIALLEPQVQYQARKLEAGFESEMEIMVNGVGLPIKLDMRCPSSWFFINPKYIDLYNSRPLGIVSSSKGEVEIPNANATNWEYRYWHAYQLATKSRNKHGIIRDIISTITSV
jgi:hypothetical protein